MTHQLRFIVLSLLRFFARVWLMGVLVLTSIAVGSCTCGPSSQPAKAPPVLVCKPQRFSPTIAPALDTKTLVPGAMAASFSVTDSGDAALRFGLIPVPGRSAAEPSLSLNYRSENDRDSGVGIGFSLSAASAITRCPKSMSIDGTIETVRFDDTDAYCLDSTRLISISGAGDTIEFRTFPDDRHVKVIGYFENTSESHFEAFLPDGSRILYGSTAASRSMSNKGVPSAWLADEQRNARGESIQFDWCMANDESGYTAEYALTSIRYSPDNAVIFAYDQRDDVQTTYFGGMQMQQSLRLAEVQMQAANALVRRYEFDYEPSKTTGRDLLQSVQECAANGSCYAPTHFHYAQVETGFDDITTNIEAPLSEKASPMLFDVDNDGLADYVVGDSTPLSTAEHPVTQWRIAKNIGGAFAAEKEALLQEWSFLQNPQEPDDPTMLQPELGTAIDFTGGSLTGIFPHDVTGSQANHIVFVPKTDLTFSVVDTKIRRPFPLGPTPKGMRSSAASIHLADVSADSMLDLIECADHGDTPKTALQSTWKVHLWQPDGFEPNGTIIETLAGIPCGIEIHTVDSNGDSITDLIMPGYLRQGGVPVELSGTYSVHRRRSDGTWEVVDTHLPTPQGSGRTVFLDGNADGLPDAVQSGSADGRLYTYMNTGDGFAKKPVESLDWDGLRPQTNYFHLAQALQFDGDNRADLLVPMVDGMSPDLPRWVILRATGGKNGFTFERIETTIPFEPVLGDAVTLADPRGPRVGELTGDASPDVAIFLGQRLHILKNRAIDPDVLVGFSNGTNDHEPDEPEFVPNVSLTYAHLIDVSKTTGQAPQATDLYVSQDDPANGCTYPRHCAVAKRVVSEYRTDDGRGGQRRFGFQYRDGRYDRVYKQWLGFGKRIRMDLDTGAATVDFYDNVTKVKIEREVYPFVGQIQKRWQWAPGLPTQPNPSQVEMVFADRTLEVVPTNGNQSYFTLPTDLHTRRMQGSFSGAGSIEAYVSLVETLENATILGDSTVKGLNFDEFGHPLEMHVSTIGVDATTHVTRTLKNDVDKWMLGLPDTQTECSTGSGLTQCRTIKRTTNEFGEVETESTSSSDGIDDTKLFVTYKRDHFGNVTKVSADDGHHREETTVYDPEGLFPNRFINGLGHETLVEYDAALGVLKKETDPNGLSIERQYDGFGRLEVEKRPDGSQTTITRTREKIDGVWRLKERTTTTGGADDETVFDSLGRAVRTFTHGPAPKANTPRIMHVIEYDRLSGQVARTSVPTSEGTPDAQLLFDEYEFDALAREIRHTTPWNAVTTTHYDGLLIDVTDPLQKHTVTKLDPLSRPVSIIDAEGGLTKYTYAPFNALFTVTDPGNDVTKWTRDAFGRVMRVDQPDRGTTTFKNSGFGDVLSSTDALGRTITWEIDTLGRTTKRLDTYAGKTLTTAWTWDTAPNGIGKLHVLTNPDAVKTYSYTKKGQLEGMILSVGDESFATQMSYDAFGRPERTRYPQPLGVEPFEITSEYDAHGFVVGVRDTATNDAYWQLTDVDNAGRYKGELFGNGVTTTRSYDGAKQSLKSINTMFGGSIIQQLSYDWTERLDLKSRTDALQPQNKTERFKYDGLNRLTCTYFSSIENSAAPCATSYGYSANGNLTFKSDVGTLSYDDAKRPHAVTGVPGESFTYDAVGNQITRPGGVAITYTPFDLPKTITQGAKVVSYGYDGDEQKVRKATPTSEVLYFDDLFEQVTSGAAKEFRYYVHSPERVVAVVTRGGNEPGTKWLHTDHLGSVESVTNEKGDAVEKRSYDAFGARRNPQWGVPGGVSPGKITKGFTGHEEEDEFGLIFMKGRLLDPHLGRFTTTDPVIANVFDGQSFGAYSYVRNNPLMLVDPTGFADQPAAIPGPFCCIEQTVITKYPDGFVPPPPPEEEPFVTPDQAGNVGASAPTNDTGTTGPGENGSPKETAEGEPIPQSRNAWDGVWDGLVDTYEHADEMVPGSSASTVGSIRTMAEVIDAYKKGDAIDAINVVNPTMPFATLGFAIDEGDWYTVGRSSVAVGVTIVAVIVGKKLAGGGTVRKHHLMTNKNYVSTARGGPWSPRFEKMAAKAGMTLKDAANEVDIPGHIGPHPKAYHEEVFRRLDKATDGLNGDAFTRAFRGELERIRTDAATPGSALNTLLVK